MFTPKDHAKYPIKHLSAQSQLYWLAFPGTTTYLKKKMSCKLLQKQMLMEQNQQNFINLTHFFKFWPPEASKSCPKMEPKCLHNPLRPQLREMHLKIRRFCVFLFFADPSD